MKKFNEPVIEVIEFAQSVVATAGGDQRLSLDIDVLPDIVG